MNDGERQAGRERQERRERERDMGKGGRRDEECEAAVTGKRRGRKTGDSGGEWTARAISGGRLTTSQLKEDTRAFFYVLPDDALFVRVPHLTLTLPGGNFLSHVYI